MPKVSVMMPVYNAEKFLSQALDSILNQDFQDFHIVVSDDASTDNSVEIIKKYVEKYPDKITALFNTSNIGVTENCNRALSYCQGKYVSLFAGDDIMLPGKFSKQVALMDDNPCCVLSYHPVEIFDSDSGKVLFVTNQRAKDDVFTTEDLLLKGGIAGGCSIMIRRDAIPNVGYDSRLKTVSDWLFFLEISMKGTLCKVDEVLAKYRKHSGGASQMTYKLLEESLYALDIFENKFSEHYFFKNIIYSAKARYIAGESFRQLVNSPVLALKLASDVMLIKPFSIKYKVLYIVCWINLNFPGGRLLGLGLNNIKYFLKKFIV